MSRHPDPQHLRLLKNDKSHQHRYKDKEVEYNVTDIRPPETMSERAKDIFREMVDKLENNFQLSEIDIEVLVIYSNNQEQLEAMEIYLRKNGLTYTIPENKDSENEEDDLVNKIKERINYNLIGKERPEVKIHKDCKTLAVKLLEGFKKLPKKTNKTNSENPFAQFGNKVSE